MNAADFSPDAPGELVSSPEGALAFVPAPLPPSLAPSWDLTKVLSAADRSLAELAGVAANLPNPHLLIQPFLRREAVLSSRIEGTVSSLEDLLAFEAGGGTPPADVQEVANYVQALEHGLSRLADLPISLRLLREMHAVLMTGVRGGTKDPGEFRRQQNWIGAGTIHAARFVPPPVPQMTIALGELERFLHMERPAYPALVNLALAHYQFEAIHPFLDGNGRVGRLLITLTLCAHKILPQPLLYLSAFFERHKAEYADRLLEISRRGAWAEWIHFFLRGIDEQARDGLERASRLLALHHELRQRLQRERAPGTALALLDDLFRMPTTTVPAAARVLAMTQQGTLKIVQRLEAAGILQPLPGTRPRMYVARQVLGLLDA